MADASKQISQNLSQPELFRRIGDICALVNSADSCSDLLESSLKQTLDLFCADRGSIFVLNENGQDLVLESAIGMNNVVEKQIVKRLGEGVVGKVAETKKPIFVEDISQDGRFLNYKARASYKAPSFICAPLLIKDNLIGVINIADKDKGTSRFKEDEVQLLDFVATQIALNYRRIELYQKLTNIVEKSKSLEDELGKSSEEATNLKKQVVIQEKFANVGKLAGGIAHEFNNPLDGVMRYTNLCLEHVSDEVVRGYLLEIKHGLKRMANIVKNLLACSRNTTSVSAKIDPNRAIEDVLQSVKPTISHRKIAIKTHLNKKVPALLDLGLERIITNLVRNALDAVGEKGEIKIVTEYEDDNVIIKVSDSGCGFVNEDVDKIFEPFYTTKDIEKGCGLGLTVVGEIVKSYDGNISVESFPKKGTTFTVTLPIG